MMISESYKKCELLALLDNCTNYAQMADIMRLEIVYLYGGIYVDMDATALRPFGKEKLDNLLL